MPWRMAIAGWPDALRERWGRLANDLEEEGMGWMEAEEAAYQQVDAERFAGTVPAARQRSEEPLERPPSMARVQARLSWG